MTGEEFQIVVKKPLSDLEKELRARYQIGTNALVNAFIEEGAVIFVFGKPTQGPNGPSPMAPMRTRRRRKSRRNRTKTRGWKPVATFTNKLDQRVRVYNVFVDALKGRDAGRGEQKKIVEGILKANGNEPTREQIEYFLDNTLEFLKSNGAKE